MRFSSRIFLNQAIKYSWPGYSLAAMHQSEVNIFCSWALGDSCPLGISSAHLPSHSLPLFEWQGLSSEEPRPQSQHSPVLRLQGWRSCSTLEHIQGRAEVDLEQGRQGWQLGWLGSAVQPRQQGNRAVGQLGEVWQQDPVWLLSFKESWRPCEVTFPSLEQVSWDLSPGPVLRLLSCPTAPSVLTPLLHPGFNTRFPKPAATPTLPSPQNPTLATNRVNTKISKSR